MTSTVWTESEYLFVALVVHYVVLLLVVAMKTDGTGGLVLIGLSSLLVVVIGPDNLLWDESWGWVLLATGSGALGMSRPRWNRDGASGKPKEPPPSRPAQLSVFSTRPDLGDEAERILQSAEIRRHDDWHDFIRAVPHTECSVLIDPWIRSDPSLERLRELQTRFPYHPLVLVTARDAEGVRRLRRLVVDQIVWDHKLRQELRPAVEQARQRGAMQHLERMFEEADGLPAQLRDAMRLACRPGFTVQTVAEFASLVDRDRRSLWRWWNCTFGESSTLSPKDFLDWITIVRASGLRASGRSWTAVANSLEIHEDTLARMARRTLGLGLGELESVGVKVVISVFLREMWGFLEGAPVTMCDDELGAETTPDRVR